MAQSKEQKAAYQKEFRKKNPGYFKKYYWKILEKRRETQRSYYYRNQDKCITRVKQYYLENSDKKKNSAKQRQLRLKIECLSFYSHESFPICRCCQEAHIEFLQLDHIQGNGSQHRKALKTEFGSVCGAKIYKILKDKGFPPGFQVLCANCNHSKWNKKYCVH